ncbi:hypothetical protein [Streptomyces sp. 8L]|uniref:hypothetical protein n=1 Tax=Streptomyces sp. 8L TaxID=2877242 RepID=UPI001CD7D887|nr:hypothetical protein [Streptomyces sp. 8L]MCA1224300.1 hypothetical protein [Streptomyces sp. 8L]
MTQTNQPWPDGVTARYLTTAGATVDITGGGDSTGYHCTACPYSSGPYWTERIAHEHAQKHADTCRALPRPTI